VGFTLEPHNIPANGNVLEVSVQMNEDVCLRKASSVGVVMVIMM
jgi:hypothetical protein